MIISLICLILCICKLFKFNINNRSLNLGEIGGGIIFDSNDVNFSDNSMASKNVQAAID